MLAYYCIHLFKKKKINKKKHLDLYNVLFTSDVYVLFFFCILKLFFTVIVLTNVLIVLIVVLPKVLLFLFFVL